MRIPLDYYRILGVPIQASDEQLTQAYQDRTLQLPRREYSDLAVSERKKLIEQAYKILSDPEQRATYNVRFLEKTSEFKSLEKTGKLNGVEVDHYTPSIEIRPEQFVGALLILLELGEYELAIGQGQEYLNTISGNGQAQKTAGQLQNERMLKSDTILTIALSHLELSREQWQQGEYENAAKSGQTSLELLGQENLYVRIQEEIQTDSNKLRPYRILELLSQNEENSERRERGLQLLKEMLQERGGIDGTGEDKSGLSIDECLRFIQQLRSYLTAKEQQELFEAEARRPSAVATYLSVYALLAGGFAQKQPALIFRAKEKLRRLSKCQDVHLEQAVCALLLGQTEEANSALEKSQESEPLAFIREHSHGSSDLLPGLCLYGERWLQTEVFSHFRDLADRQTSLKEYFADAGVQAYLEQLPEEVASEPNYLEKEKDRPIAASTAQSRARINNSFQKKKTEKFEEPARVFNGGDSGSRPQFLGQSESSKQAGQTALMSGSAPASGSRATMLDRSSNSVDSSSLKFNPKQYNRSQRLKALREQIAKSSVALDDKGKNLVDRPQARRRQIDKNKNRWRFLKINGPIGFSLSAIVAVVALGSLSQKFEFAKIWEPDSNKKNLVLELDKPLITTPSTPSPVSLPKAKKPEAIDKESAAKVIQTWLDRKSEAFGVEHQIDGLNEVLSGSLLSRWRAMALDLKQNNAYREYQHRVEIRSVKFDEKKSSKATVEAAIEEIAKHYRGGKIEKANSYKDRLLVRYELARDRERWLIDEILVLK